MILQSVLANLNKAGELIESSYKLIEDHPTNSEIETIVKNKLLVKLKNTLVENVILTDIVNELVENPDDIITLETILDLVSDAEELLS